MTDPVIELQGVGYAYDGPPVLSDIDLTIPAGEFLGVVGPNAGGKSTLLKLILGLIEPTTGQIKVLGSNPTRARVRLGYVPQYPVFARDFPITVEQVVLMGRLGLGRWFGGYRAVDRRVAQRAMGETEVAHLAGRHIQHLSGGQLQRVLVARALAAEPEVLLLDEPTANIDQRMETDIFELLRGLNARMTIVVVSHDVAFISGYVQRVACLNRTLVCHDTAAIDGDAIQKLYGDDVRMVAHHHAH